MDCFSGIVVFILVWWIVLFTVLPIGVVRDTRGPDVTAHGAPQKAQMKKKMLITTAIACVIWLMILGLIDADIISFREMANTMIAQDHVK